MAVLLHSYAVWPWPIHSRRIGSPATHIAPEALAPEVLSVSAKDLIGGQRDLAAAEYLQLPRGAG